MNTEKLIAIAKIIILSTLSIVIVTTLFNLIYPLTQQGIATIEINEITVDTNTKQYSKIQTNRELFSFVNEYKETTVVEEEDEEIDVHVSGGLYSNYSKLSQQCNMELYNLCYKYFLTKFNGKQLSPLYPMAIANNESAIRADKNITFTSLYPSLIVPPTSVEDIEKFSCADVLKSSTVFNKLADDWWTRDRGPVQMMGSYGIHEDKFNKMLGESEYNKLSKFSNLYDYTAYTTKEGIISADEWIDKASKDKGDRFNVKDICLRLSSETTYALGIMQETYTVNSERLAMVMLSMYHGAASLWNSNYVNSEIGYWKSGMLAYEYAQAIASDKAYDIIYNCARDDILTARVNSTNPDVGISTSKATILYNKLMAEGFINSINTYTVAGTYRDDYIVYPIKMLYNFAQLQILYNGG